jgi:trk system potassium uptake protein TrkH
LITQDTASYFSTAGQIIIMVLFQLGGLGIMTFSTLILLVAGKRVSIKDRIIIQEGFHHSSIDNVTGLIKRIFLYALSIELAGTLLFFLHWHKEFSFGKAVFNSFFHSISAFCNAGFTLFSNSFESFRSDEWVHAVLMVLIVLGGLGFLVLHECSIGLPSFLKKRRFKMSLHAKMVLTLTLIIILASSGLFLAIEWNDGLEGMTMKDKIMGSLFQAVTTRTAGFNTINLRALTLPGIFLLFLLMFIGASPGSTGGGVKTSTLGVVLAFLKSKVKARDSVSLFKRTLPSGLILKAFTVVTLAMMVIALSTFLLFLFQPEFGMRKILFEVFSAFGTVGLSLGITSELSTAGKLIIILTMYVGRIGPLTLLYVFSREKAYGRFEYVEESVMVG